MRLAVIGRTSTLLGAARLAAARGHSVRLVWTCRAEAHYAADEEDFAAFARDVGAHFECDPGLGASRRRGLIAELGCEVGLSVNWPRVIPREVFAMLPHGLLNAHAGDLPRYRGNACPNWAILRGEPHVGLCVHQMAENIDSGPVVLRERYPLTDSTYIGDVYTWVEAVAPGLLVAAAEGLVAGSLRPDPQEGSGALRTYPRRAEDSRIDWWQSTDAVLRLVRASSRPFAGAFTSLEGMTPVRIWRASRVAQAEELAAVPGQVCFGMAGDPVIASGDGLVRLEEIEMEGEDGSPAAKRRILRSLRHRLR